MTPAAILAATLAGYAVAAAGVLVLAPPGRTLGTVPVAPATACGAALGLLLFTGFARTRPPLRALGRRPPRGLVVLLLAAGCEEVVWRGGLLAGLTGPIGIGGALAATTVAFTLRHRLSSGAAATTYGLLGATFGGLYLATGQLAAAVTAHVGYDWLVLAARMERAP
jgi:Type II CAAX prenyl endopeptidase Rce1-like